MQANGQYVAVRKRPERNPVNQEGAKGWSKIDWDCLWGSWLCHGRGLDHWRKYLHSKHGDCRAVLNRGGSAVVLSTDHKPTNPLEKSRIIKSGGKVINGRINNGLNVSRALGDFKLKRSSVTLKTINYWRWQVFPKLDRCQETRMTSSSSWVAMAFGSVMLATTRQWWKSYQCSLKSMKVIKRC